MKRLNNRGFAITAVLYGLLILFLLLFLGMIRILNTERKRMAQISDEIDDSIVNMEKITIDSSEGAIGEGGIYVTPYRGKYVFYIGGDTSKEYYMYLPIYSIVSINGGKIKVTSGTSQRDIEESSFLVNNNLMNDNGISQANSGITSITITAVYTSVRKVSGDTP